MHTIATNPPTATGSKALRGVLVVLGAISAFVAINVAFGGLKTLGWQGPTDYFRVTDHDAFLVRDSHAHYYGGVYLAVGIFLILAATNVAKYRQGLMVVFAMIFAGGLARLAQLEPGVTFGSALMVSTLIELVGVPLLALWVNRATRPVRAATGTVGLAPAA
jgi:hypothetical protein